MWKQSFIDIVASLDDRLSERFFILVAWGQYGPYSQHWTESFGQLGILHLLVLSGSQMILLVKAQTSTFLVLTRPQGLHGLRKGLPILILLSTFYYLYITGFSPPLLRAFLLFWITALLEPIGKQAWALPLSFLSHIVLIPAHLSKLSFFLSWFCFLILYILQDIVMPQWMRCVLLSLLSQFVVIYFGLQDYLGSMALIKILFANLVFIYIFEYYLSFILGFLMSTSFLIALFPAFLYDVLLAVIQFLFPLMGRGLMILIQLARNALLWV